jgi:hypothetical protein
MPQFDTFIFSSILFYFIISYFVYLYVNSQLFLPRLAALLKLRFYLLNPDKVKYQVKTTNSHASKATASKVSNSTSNLSH